MSINRAAAVHRNVHLWVSRSRAIPSMRGYSQSDTPAALQLLSLNCGARLCVFGCRPMIFLSVNLLALDFI